MDAVVVLKTIARMCNSYGRCSAGCPLKGICVVCRDEDETHPELIIAAVEKWRKEHPAKTRQSEILKIFPNAPTDADGNIRIHPCVVDEKLRAETCGTGRCGNNECGECTREYWLEEIK